MKKFFSAVCLAASLIFVVGAPTSAQSPENNFRHLTATVDRIGVVSSNIDFLALREGPSVNYRLLLRIPPGARVQVTLPGVDSWAQSVWWRDYDDNFIPVTYNGVKGYSHGKYITLYRYDGSRVQ